MGTCFALETHSLHSWCIQIRPIRVERICFSFGGALVLHGGNNLITVDVKLKRSDLIMVVVPTGLDTSSFDFYLFGNCWF